MTKRQSISKQNRFEVFKRDSFSCQYCGVSAPEATLQIDHIHPVSKGGDNSIANLVTACFDCNSGKSDRQLSDESRVQREKRQLDRLQERREQIEMMAAWRAELSDLIGAEADFLSNLITSQTGFEVSEHGLRKIKKMLRSHSAEHLAGSVDDAFYQYFEREGTPEAFDYAFSMIDRIAKAKKREINPHQRKMYYIRGILRNKSSSMNPRSCLAFLEQAVSEGFDPEYLECVAKSVRSWGMFRNVVVDAMQENHSA